MRNPANRSTSNRSLPPAVSLGGEDGLAKARAAYASGVISLGSFLLYERSWRWAMQHPEANGRFTFEQVREWGREVAAQLAAATVTD